MDSADTTLCEALLMTHGYIGPMHLPSSGPLLDAEDRTIHVPKASYAEPDCEDNRYALSDQRSAIRETCSS